MQPQAQTSRLTLLVLSSSIVLGIALGSRQAYGVLIGPYSALHAWSVGIFAFVVALQNLLWGAAQPFTSAIADEWGAHWVAAAGGLMLASGLFMTALTDSQLIMLIGSGILVGVGLSATGFALVLSVVGRAAPVERRGAVMGLVGMFGAAVTMAMSLMADFLTQQFGVNSAMMVMGALALAMVPMGLLMRVGVQNAPSTLALSQPSLRKTVGDAWGHSGFRWLTIGFFVCGFQVAFIGIHLPGYLSTCNMPASLGGITLAVLSGFNMIGSWGCGTLAQRYRPKQVLSLIYLLRSVAIILFVTLPVSIGSSVLFAAAIGMMWLGTVPLTNALIAGIFGTRYMATLFGIVFFSHQVGSFFGAWAGGVAFDFTGSYDSVWYFSAAIGVLASLIHLPIRDAPLAAHT